MISLNQFWVFWEYSSNSDFVKTFMEGETLERIKDLAWRQYQFLVLKISQLLRPFPYWSSPPATRISSLTMTAEKFLLLTSIGGIGSYFWVDLLKTSHLKSILPNQKKFFPGKICKVFHWGWNLPSIQSLFDVRLSDGFLVVWDHWHYLPLIIEIVVDLVRNDVSVLKRMAFD